MKYFSRTFGFIVAVCFAAPVFAICNTAADGDLFTDKDNPSASDSNNGSANSPFATIQKLVDTLQAGQCGFVRETALPYFEDVRKSGSDFGGVTIDNSGTAASPIVISGFPGERPVIDIGRRTSTDQNKEMAGFFVWRANYVTIRNFEIRGTSASGIFVAPGVTNLSIIIEGNHIHHSYGRDNIGGVRLDRCDQCIVRNNLIHDMYDTRRTGNSLNSEPYGLHSGVHGYEPSNSVIENNLIHTVAKGVFQKQANTNQQPSHVVRYNIFQNVAGAAYELNLRGAGRPAINGSSFHHNLVIDSYRGVYAALSDAGTQGSDLSIYNNTFVRTSEVASLGNVQGIQVYNNVISGRNSSATSSFVFATVDARNWMNSVAVLDYNFYSPSAQQGWIFDRYASNAVAVNSIAELRSRGFAENSSVTEISFAGSNDFALVPTGQWSSAGRAGDQVGAFGGRPVGPTDGAGISVPTPMNDWGQ